MVAEPPGLRRDHPGMLELNRTKGSALLSCGLMLSPPALDPTPEPTE
jgi:hypothetical protein